MNAHPTRRDILAGAAAAAATGWADQRAQAGSARPNLFSVLGGKTWLGSARWRFLGADGAEVNVLALETSLRHHYTTGFVSYVGCEQYCPLTLSHMASLSGSAAQHGIKLMHVIVNAIPEQQGIGPLRDTALDDIELRGLKPFRPGRALADSNAIVLFATRDGHESGLDNALPAAISEALGNITRHDSATDHSSYVTLYAPGGAPVGRTSGTAPNAAETLAQQLRTAAAGRGR